MYMLSIMIYLLMLISLMTVFSLWIIYLLMMLIKKCGLEIKMMVNKRSIQFAPFIH